jgi:CRISPR-associated protein Cst2
VNAWKEPDFKGWDTEKGKTYIDDDLLGFMKADAAKEEGESGYANVRRAVFEVTRAVSLTPWAGDMTFNAASPGATPSAAKGGTKERQNPVPYGTEVHATRYQYGIALTPERLRDKSRAAKAIDALCKLGTVAGNHGRFLFDFSPDAVVFRITDDPAPRLLYCFESTDDGKTVQASALVARLESGDIAPGELIVGVSDTKSPLAAELGKHDLKVQGVKAACETAVATINQRLGVKG